MLSSALLAVAAAAAAGPPGASSGADAGQTGARYRAGMGTVTVGDRQLYRLSLRPEIPFGKLAVALDVELFIGDDGSVESRGWSFGTAAETFDSFLRKIYYVRYGQPGDDVFVRLGALDGVTLGYGLIVDRYRNTLDYPGLKRTGVRFQLDHLGDSDFGVEGVIGNLQDLEEGGALVGLRLFGRPAPRVEVGLTYAVDLDQYAGLLDRDGDGYPDAVDAFPRDDGLALDNDGDGVDDGADGDDDNDGAIDVDAGSGLPGDVVAALADLERTHPGRFAVDGDVARKSPFDKGRVGADPFSLVGLDAGYHLLQSEPLRLTLYGQLGFMVDDDDALSDAAADSQGVERGNRKATGMGIIAPGLRAQAGPVDGRLEYRFFQDDFDAGYFDNLYDLDRARLDVATGRALPKDAQLRRGQDLSGLFGRVEAQVLDVAFAGADYQHLTGSGDSKRQLHADASLSARLLQTVPRLSQADAYFQKNNIGARPDRDGTPGSEDGFFEPTEDMFYGYEMGFEMASGVSVVFDTRYLFARGADGHLDRRKILSIETVFSF